MAKIVFYRDDFDGTEDSTVQPRVFRFENGTLNIDLSDANYGTLTNALMAAVEPYRLKGEWTERETGNDENTLIREWARANGRDVSSRGRIAQDVIDAYREAHKSESTPVEPDNDTATDSDTATDNGNVSAPATVNA